MKKFYNIVMILVILSVAVPAQLAFGYSAFSKTSSHSMMMDGSTVVPCMGDSANASDMGNSNMDCGGDCLSKCLMQVSVANYLLPDMALFYAVSSDGFQIPSDVSFNSVNVDSITYPPITIS